MSAYKKDEVLNFMKAAGCVYLRNKGDHIIFQCGKEQISIPLHGYRNTVFEGIVQESIKAVCRQTGMSYQALNKDIASKGIVRVTKNLEKFGPDKYRVDGDGVAAQQLRAANSRVRTL